MDRGRFAPDRDCDQDGNTACFYHQGAQHCVVTAIPKSVFFLFFFGQNTNWYFKITLSFYFSSHDGAGQQCCYDLAGYLMLTADNKWGGNPLRNHNLGTYNLHLFSLFRSFSYILTI